MFAGSCPAPECGGRWGVGHASRRDRADTDRTSGQKRRPVMGRLMVPVLWNLISNDVRWQRAGNESSIGVVCRLCPLFTIYLCFSFSFHFLIADPLRNKIFIHISPFVRNDSVMDCFTCDAYLLTIVFGHVTRQISWPQRCPLMRFTVFRNYPGWKRPAWTGKSWRFEAIKFLIIFRKVQKTLRSVSVAKRNRHRRPTFS